MASHSVKLNTVTYAQVVLAAGEAGQTISQWMEAAALAALARQDHAGKVARYRNAHIRAAERGDATPLPRDFGLSPSHS